MVATKARAQPATPVEDEADEPEDSPYMTFAQVVESYDISRQSLHRLCTDRRLPYYTTYNGRRRFLKEEMEEYLGLRKVEALDPLPKRGEARSNAGRLTRSARQRSPATAQPSTP